MPPITTVPTRVEGIPLVGLRAVVVDGPNTGLSIVATTDRLTLGTAPGNDVTLTDPTVSRYHLEMIRDADRIRLVDHGSTNGTFVGLASVSTGSVPAGAILTLGKTKVRVEDGSEVTVPLHGDEALEGLLGRSPAMRRVMAEIDRISKGDGSVLVVGESGTGKELVARAIHARSPRSKEPFETVDCGALSQSLIASELFGHERGAFTGAEKRYIGAFERGNGGTVFLDELGELPASMQPSLLGALERRRFRRVGGSEEIGVDVRIIAATNRDLRAEVNQGTFRLDLYYRLAVVLIELPPLRERRDDIAALVQHFLWEEDPELSVDAVVDPETMRAIIRHHWPGNVRELRNFVQAMVATGRAPALDSARNPPAAGSGGDLIEPLLGLPYRDARRVVVDEFERRFIRSVVQRSGGNVSQAARNAKMDRSHLVDLLRRHGFE